MTVHHYSIVKTVSCVIDDIITWQKRSLGQVWGGGGLGDNFMVTRWEMGISTVSNQEKNTKKTKVNSVL